MQSAASADLACSRRYVLSFSDEFDEATFDLNGRSFRLGFVGVQIRLLGRVATRLYEFAFVDEPIRDRAGIAVAGSLFIGLSPGLEESPGPWGARVLAFDASGEMVPIGRAHLAVKLEL
jgi:hypothetical protein|tara:strand:- start:1498 stop:1854 length:357 start_codon:yes stop_codon:yes gene_type:complete